MKTDPRGILQTDELTDLIRSLLAGRPSSVAGELLAAEYGRMCREVNGRLGKIRMMLESGGEIQALQLAEEPPAVVDLAVALSFGGEVPWQGYCRDHGYEVAPLVDARGLDLLLELQHRGLASNHPLYRDYRSAVSLRDDEKALNLIRVIARLNPGDPNAAKELKRLRQKFLRAALSELKVAAEAGGEVLLAAMRRVEEVGEREDYEDLPEWRQACDLRERVRRGDAWRRMPGLLDLAARELDGGDWRKAAVAHGEFTRLSAMYGYSEDNAGLAARAREIGATLDRHREESGRDIEARQLQASLAHLADEVCRRQGESGGLPALAALAFVEEIDRGLARLALLKVAWGSDGAGERVQAARVVAARVLARWRRTRRLLAGAMAGVAALVLAAAVGLGVSAWQAGREIQGLAAMRTAGDVDGVRERARLLAEKTPWMLWFPRMAAAVRAGTDWAAGAEEAVRKVEEDLARLEESELEGFGRFHPEELLDRLAGVDAGVEALPAGVRQRVAKRFGVLRDAGQREVARRRDQVGVDAGRALAKWRAELDGIDRRAPAAVVAQRLAPALEELRPWAELAADGGGAVMAPEVAEAVKELEEVLREVEAQLAEVAAAVGALGRAGTVDLYRGALERLGAAGFAEGAAARAAAGVLPEDAALRAGLLFRGDVDALGAAAADPGGSLPYPAEASALDREVLAKLGTSDAFLNVWEVVWQNGRGVKLSCLSRGAVVRNGKAGWKGEFANYPQLGSTPPKFSGNTIPAAGGNILLANRPTAGAKLLERMKLLTLFTDDGTGFRKSVLPLIDLVVSDSEAPPLAKAYLCGQLFRMVRNHPPEAWGLQYYPALRAHIEAFEALDAQFPALESSWLLEKPPAGAERWEAYFRERAGQWGWEEGRRLRMAAAEVVRAPFEVAGRVDLDGGLVLADGARPGLWMVVVPGGVRVLGVVAPGQEVALGADVPPLSPVLTMALGEEQQKVVAELHQEQGGQGKPAAP